MFTTTMKCLWTVICIVISVCVLDVNGLPNGAPQNHKMCRNLKPRHNGVHGQVTQAPFLITPLKSKIPIGGSVNVTISAKAGASYKGFVMQARPRMIGNPNYIRPIGQFKILDAANSKTLNCLSAVKNTVTHSNPSVKKSTSFIWVPPPKYKGKVYFRAAFVTNFTTFWLNVSSSIVVGEGDTDGDSQIEGVDSEDDVEIMDEAVYEGCGITKECFGVPDGCLGDQSCDILATLIEKDRELELEYFGVFVQSVTAGISEGGSVDVDSLTTCAFVNNSVKLLKHNGGLQSPFSVSNDVEELITSSFVDGLLYCRFRIKEMGHENDISYDIKNSEYVLALSAGDFGTGIENMDVKKVHFHTFKTGKYSLASNTSKLNRLKYTSIVDNSFHKKVVSWIFGFINYFTHVR